MFAVRFHTDNDQKVIEWAADHTAAFLVMEDATRTHIQGVIKSDKTIRALRESIRREFDELAGNKGYSLKLCDEDYINYLCKGPSKDEQEEPIILLNTFVNNVMERHEAWWKVNARHKELKKKSVLQELIEWHKEFKLATRQQLAIKAMELVDERNQSIRQHVIKSWVDTAWFKMHHTCPWVDNL